MQVIHLSYGNIKNIEANVCGFGYFDGVHLGHQKLINEVKEIAKEKNVKSAIFTFSKSIDVVLGKEFHGEITPLEHRIKIFEQLGLDICFVFEFNKEISELDPVAFINEVIKPLNTKTFCCGSDYRFGFRGQGDIDLVSKYFDVKVVDFLNVINENYKISSRNIIKSVQEADFETVKTMLGREYFIEGEVVRGLGNGTKIGFPTANIDYSDFVLPKDGVYLVSVNFEGKIYKGLANIGVHPTISELKKPSLEVYIDNFNKNIYGKMLKVVFVKFIRKQERFSDIENLKSQLKLDTFFNF